MVFNRGSDRDQGLLADGTVITTGLDGVATVLTLSAGLAPGVGAADVRATVGLGAGCAGAVGVGANELAGTLATFAFSGVVAGGTLVEIAPSAHIWARFALFISNSIDFRLGTRGSAGSVIDLPLIVIWTAEARERE